MNVSAHRHTPVVFTGERANNSHGKTGRDWEGSKTVPIGGEWERTQRHYWESKRSSILEAAFLFPASPNDDPDVKGRHSAHSTDSCACVKLIRVQNTWSLHLMATSASRIGHRPLYYVWCTYYELNNPSRELIWDIRDKTHVISWRWQSAVAKTYEV
jgi:hypothetical protein